jgi:Fe-S cluster assembly protein SufB
MTARAETLEKIASLAGEGYKYGFFTDIESEQAPLGLNEGTVRFISAKKKEPQWLLEWRLQAFRDWQKMEQPDWAKLLIAPINYQGATYYSAPRQKAAPKSLDEVDPELLRTYEKLGIPLREQQRFQGIAVDAVFDSVFRRDHIQGAAR